jgi:hypothetical protein
MGGPFIGASLLTEAQTGFKIQPGAFWGTASKDVRREPPVLIYHPCWLQRDAGFFVGFSSYP